MQLHVSDSRVEEFMGRVREELGGLFRYLELVYEDALADGRVTSVSTMYTIVNKTTAFLRWLRGRGVAPPEMGADDVRGFLIWLRRRGFRPSSLYTYVRVLRRALRVWGRDDLLEYARYPRVRMVYRLPDPEVVEEVIASIPNITYKTIVALLYETGMRVSECLSLRVSDVEEAPEGYYKLRVLDTKNGEERLVFVIRYASLLREYLNVNRPEGYLFPSPSRPGKPIHPNNVERLLRKYGRRYGVKLTPHTLRHVAATKMIKEGVQERVVMKLLGHKTEKMLRIYVNLTARDVEEALLTKYGIAKQSNERRQVLKCPRCGAENPPGARYCWRCGLPLSAEAAEEKERRKEELQKAIEELKKILKERPELLSKLLT